MPRQESAVAPCPGLPGIGLCAARTVEPLLAAAALRPLGARRRLPAPGTQLLRRRRRQSPDWTPAGGRTGAPRSPPLFSPRPPRRAGHVAGNPAPPGGVSEGAVLGPGAVPGTVRGLPTPGEGGGAEAPRRAGLGCSFPCSLRETLVSRRRGANAVRYRANVDQVPAAPASPS